MKQVGWLVAFLLGVALLLTVVLLLRRPHVSADCPSGVIIVKGSRGEMLECVCVAGTLSTCFNPGP
jgi:hypothetical protein